MACPSARASARNSANSSFKDRSLGDRSLRSPRHANALGPLSRGVFVCVVREGLNRNKFAKNLIKKDFRYSNERARSCFPHPPQHPDGRTNIEVRARAGSGGSVIRRHAPHSQSGERRGRALHCDAQCGWRCAALPPYTRNRLARISAPMQIFVRARAGGKQRMAYAVLTSSLSHMTALDRRCFMARSARCLGRGSTPSAHIGRFDSGASLRFECVPHENRRTLTTEWVRFPRPTASRNAIRGTPIPRPIPDRGDHHVSSKTPSSPRLIPRIPSRFRSRRCGRLATHYAACRVEGRRFIASVAPAGVWRAHI
jgi:hypothetical protein